MGLGNAIQILKATFNFDPTLDIPGIGVCAISLSSNLLSQFTSAPMNPIFTWIMTGLAGVYLVIKIRNAILTGRSIKLDNELKKKNLAE